MDATISVFDPEAMGNVRSLLGDKVRMRKASMKPSWMQMHWLLRLNGMNSGHLILSNW